MIEVVKCMVNGQMLCVTVFGECVRICTRKVRFSIVSSNVVLSKCSALPFTRFLTRKATATPLVLQSAVVCIHRNRRNKGFDQFCRNIAGAYEKQMQHNLLCSLVRLC